MTSEEVVWVDYSSSDPSEVIVHETENVIPRPVTNPTEVISFTPPPLPNFLPPPRRKFRVRRRVVSSSQSRQRWKMALKIGVMMGVVLILIL
jgi:hypothetical protein